MTVVLDVAADGDQPALCLRPWLLADMPDLLAAAADEYPSQGLGSHPDLSCLFPQRWSGPRNAEEAEVWLSGQERGWENGDWLTFAVTDVSQDKAVGHVGLWNRDGGLPRIMLVHDLDNPASCRVAAKSGYPFQRLSPRTHPTGSPTDTSTWPSRLHGECDG
jgi:RimJ/RimL family protein N-acetyltransferase